MKENTWTSEHKYAFDYRIKLMAGCIDFAQTESVMDISCSDQGLRKYVPPAVEYTGYDIHRHCPDTVICDFNNGGVIDKSADAAILSGIIEYIYDPLTFVNNILSKMPGGGVFVASYHFTEDCPERGELWVNSMSKKEFYGALRKKGWRLAMELFIGNQTIFAATPCGSSRYLNTGNIARLMKEAAPYRWRLSIYRILHCKRSFARMNEFLFHYYRNKR